MILVAVLIPIGILAALYRIGTEDMEYHEALDLTDIDSNITADEFARIEMGMSLEEVESIIGGKGKIMYEDSNRIECSWPGEYYVADSEHFRFDTVFSKSDNALYTFEEDDIVFGETARKYEDMHRADDFSEIATVIKKRQLKRLDEDMSYNEVASALGGTGTKISEKTTVETKGGSQFRNYETRKYVTYAWKGINKNDGKEQRIDLTFADDKLMWSPMWLFSPKIE